jgi:hypothetical protein
MSGVGENPSVGLRRGELGGVEGREAFLALVDTGG